MDKAFVLFSGGLDSTTALYIADRDFDEVEAVSIDYGQRHKREIDCAAIIASRLGFRHTILRLEQLLAGSMLTDAAAPIPNVTYDEIKGVSPTYVPFRNGLMLSMLTAYAQKWVTDKSEKNYSDRRATLYFGAHAEDAQNWAYPDCTPEFIGAMANAIFIGSYQTIRLCAPLMNMVKHEIVSLGVNLGVPFEDTWSCYAGGQSHCGECPTCHARRDAFRAAGVADPTIYYGSGTKKLSLKTDMVQR